MFIHEMTERECHDALKRADVGHLASARDNQPYVVPLNFAFDDHYIYGFTTPGQKVDWMRANPLVCFEVTKVIDHNHWTSIIAFGKFEELPDKPEFEPARSQAHEYLKNRAMWWEPAYVSPEHQDRPHSLTPIFFRIRIDSMTGHHATPGPCECGRRTETAAAEDSATTSSAAAKSRGWLARIWLGSHVNEARS